MSFEDHFSKPYIKKKIFRTMDDDENQPEKIPIIVTSSGVMQGPGPGAYDTRGTIAQVPAIKIKGRYTEKVDSSAPPFVMLPSTIGQGRKWRIGNRPYEKSSESTPGPCWAPPAFGAGSPRMPIGRRQDSSPREITPGPSDYDTTIKETIKGGSFHGPSERSLATNNSSCTPGPADYSYDINKQYHSPRMAIGTRHNDTKITPGPGPGEYDTRMAMKPKKYGGYIGNRTNNSGKEITPGPSDYATNTDLLRNVPKVHIYGRPKDSPRSSSPGPYSLPMTFGNGPKYSFRSRPADKSSDISPGSYYAPPPFGSDSPKAHIGGRYDKNNPSDVTPGPSDYAVSTSLVNLKKASVFHGVSDRSMAVKNTSPGPAQYFPQIKSSSPRITIKGAFNRQSKVQASGEYVAYNTTLGGPKYTISPRTNVQYSF